MFEASRTRQTQIWQHSQWAVSAQYESLLISDCSDGCMVSNPCLKPRLKKAHTMDVRQAYDWVLTWAAAPLCQCFMSEFWKCLSWLFRLSFIILLIIFLLFSLCVPAVWAQSCLLYHHWKQIEMLAARLFFLLLTNAALNLVWPVFDLDVLFQVVLTSFYLLFSCTCTRPVSIYLHVLYCLYFTALNWNKLRKKVRYFIYFTYVFHLC